MTTTIYYFSGTGNSLHAARRIASAVAGKAVNIARLPGNAGITESSEAIGVVFPTYFGDLPEIVKAFLDRLQIAGKPYFFAVATYGVMPGNVLHALDRQLKAKGVELSAGFTMAMPDNAYTKVNFVTPLEQREPMLQAAEARLTEIASAVSRRQAVPISGKIAIISAILSGTMKAMNRNLQRSFYTTGACTGCRSCEKICPAGNIRVNGTIVMWGSQCIKCLACFHWCPQQAVQLDKKSAAVARYHHPQVSEKDLAAREA